MEISVRLFNKNSGSFSLKKRKEDAGYDIIADRREVVREKRVAKIPTGIFLAIPEGVCCLVKNRSSFGIEGFNKTSELIDPGYRGEIHVCLDYNGQSGDYIIEKGDRIAQLLFIPYFDVNFIEVKDFESLGKTERGELGFGSTGK